MEETTLVERKEAEHCASYAPAAVERRWQTSWAAQDVFSTGPPDGKDSVCVFADCAKAPLDLEQVRGFAIADAYARFRRAKGGAVLFSIGFDASAERAERDVEETRVTLRRLGFSVDWGRWFESTDPASRGLSQALFLALLERGAVYRRGSRWFLRRSLYAAENDHGLDELAAHWSIGAVAAQREALGRADGVEVEALVLGGGKLSVFVPIEVSAEDAAFVAVTPDHAEISALVAPETGAAVDEAERSGWWRRAGGWERMPAVDTGLQASVPDVSVPLPIVIAPLVARFGEAAVLGVPDRDEAAAAIAEQLERQPEGALRLTQAKGRKREAVCYGIADIPVSGRDGGAPVPVIRCGRCNSVPAAPERLPLPDHRGDGAFDLACPRCGRAARLSDESIDSRLVRMWTWLSVCVPVEDRANSLLGHAAFGDWLPALRVVGEAHAGEALLDQRAMAKFLCDSDRLPPEAREPFARTVTYGRVLQGDDGSDTGLQGGVEILELLDRVGADAVHLGLLNAAAPRTGFVWDGQQLRRALRFLETLWAYAEPRLGQADAAGVEIDPGRPWRRRLLKWCRLAAEKVSLDIEGLEMQRATHNAILLLTRIQGFERRIEEADGELGEEDRQAIAAALLVLLQLLAPFVPHIAEELWARSGARGLIAETPWPEIS